MVFSATLICVICTCLLHYSSAMDRLAEEKEILDMILGNIQNNTSIRPAGPAGSDAVVAITNMYVRSISEIDDVNMEFKIQLTFRQQWHDSRLAFEEKNAKHTKFITLLDPSNIWTPDVFFSNEKDGHFHNILRPNILVRIHPNGHVLFSTRISLKLACSMDLAAYPLDSQVCSVILGSYGYTTEELVFKWKEGTPVTVSKNLHLANFKFAGSSTATCTSGTSTGEYTCLRLDLRFKRDLTFYLYQVYIPFSFLVILSWIPFWLDYRETTARVSIWVTTLLVMAITSSSIQSKLPSLSSTKAIDVWTGVCWSFLFAVILEFVVIAQVAFREEKNVLAASDDHAENNGHQESQLGKVGKWLKNYPSRMQRIDVISRIGFPLAFIAFNVIYWASYVKND